MISDSSVATCYKACYLQFYESDFIMMYKEMRIPNPSYPSWFYTNNLYILNFKNYNIRNLIMS
jgi:hypothetical protein